MSSSVFVKKVSAKDVIQKKGDGYIKEKREAIDVLAILAIPYPVNGADYAIQLLHRHLNHNCFITVVDRVFKEDDQEVAYITLEKEKKILDDNNPRIEKWEEVYQINIRTGKIARVNSAS